MPPEVSDTGTHGAGNREDENLKKWLEAGGPKKWVAAHAGQWVDHDLEALLGELREGPFWPMQEATVRSYVATEAWKHLGAANRRQERSKQNQLNRPAWQYAFGLSVLGLACGFFAGASSTPVVGTLIPLLFALIGGTSGIYLATADLGGVLIDWRLRWVGRVTGAFGIACLLGSVPGTMMRLHFAHEALAENLTTLWHGSSTDSLQLAALRTKLKLLGLGKNEQEFLLKLASDELKSMAQPVPPERLKKLIDLSSSTYKDLESAKVIAKENKVDTPDDVEDLSKTIQNFVHHAFFWSNNGMPRDLFAIDLDSLFYRLSQLAIQNKIDNLKWMEQVKFQRSSLDATFQLVHEEFRNRDVLNWRMGGLTGEQVDKLLQWVLKANARTDPRDEFMPDVDLDAISKKEGTSSKEEK